MTPFAQNKLNSNQINSKYFFPEIHHLTLYADKVREYSSFFFFILHTCRRYLRTGTKSDDMLGLTRSAVCFRTEETRYSINPTKKFYNITRPHASRYVAAAIVFRAWGCSLVSCTVLFASSILLVLHSSSTLFLV